MAWQAYIDSLKAYFPDGSDACGIFGQNGSTWAQENLDHVSTNYTEIISVCGLYTDPSSGFANGFDFNGEKWVLIKADDESIQAKAKGANKGVPLCIHRCNTCIVVMVGKNGVNGGSVNVAVAKMAQYLKDNNY